MKRMLMAIMAVAVLVAFSAPSFADETKKKEEKDKKTPKHMVYGEEKKKDEKRKRRDEEVIPVLLARLAGLRGLLLLVGDFLGRPPTGSLLEDTPLAIPRSISHP